MNNEKFDRLVAESTRSSLMESQRVDEAGLIKAGKNLWKGFNAARKGVTLGKAGVAGSKAANIGRRIGHSMGFGRNAAQANALKGGSKGYAAALRLNKLQRNANRWRMAGGMGAAGLAGYGLGGGNGETPGADMAGAGMDGTYPGTDTTGAAIGGTYSGGTYPGDGMYPGGMYPGGTYPGDGMYPGWMYPGDGMYPGWMYPGGGYDDGFYGPDPNSLYAYMGGSPYGYGYGGAYDDGGMDPMMMYYMMNGGWGF